MLIGVVVLFMICYTPTASILIYNHFHKSKTAKEESVKKSMSLYTTMITTSTYVLQF